MSLELATFDVERVEMGKETKLSHRVLSINEDELKRLILENQQVFSDVKIDVVNPGDDVRIVHVIDIVEPRVRVTEPGTDFPGMLGKPRTVGEGRTHRLLGVVVTEVAPPVPSEPTYWREAIFDMSGEAAKYSPYSATINIVLTFVPNLGYFPEVDVENIMSGGAKVEEYNRAIRTSGLKVAVHLGKTTQDLCPDRLVSYDLGGDAGGNPRVVYLLQGGAYVYGQRIAGRGGTMGSSHLPTLLHPNEILDGAMVNAGAGPASMRACSYAFQNHPVIEELYAHDGRDLSFKGVIIFTNGDNMATKERVTSYAAKLASLVRADGAVVSYSGGGHPIVDVMMTCQNLEQNGIKTTLLLDEMAANPEDSGHVHFVNEANAIVSVGNYEQMVDLPPVPKVLGGLEILPDGERASGPLHLSLRYVIASTDQYGLGMLRGREH